MDKKKKKRLILGGGIGIGILCIIGSLVYRAIKTVPYVARSYSQVYEIVKPSTSIFDWLGFGGNGFDNGLDGDVVYSNEVDNATAAVKPSENYSNTNVQVEGIDEADIIKTDGEYLYLLTKNMVRIMKVKDGNVQEISKITIENRILLDLYLEQNTLFVISEEEYDEYNLGIENVDTPRGNNRVTFVTSYDLSIAGDPKEIVTQSQSGGYETSRLSDGYLYLFTRLRIVPQNLERDQIETYIPSVNDTCIEADCIVLPEVDNPDSYLVVSSYEVVKPEKVVDTKAILSNANTYYVSDKHIYAAGYSFTSVKTELIKMRYKNGTFSFVAREKIKGSVKDSFCMDEYKENLRIVVTEQDRSDAKSRNHLYVLNDKLQVIGSVKNLAKGEQIYSARFMDNTAYFVTFLQTDPLYAVDLSNPKEPKVLDALKITGFSSYLHFYKENLLLGIGKEVDPETGAELGVKLSMFDISDRTNIKEIDKYVIENSYDAEALENHKAVLIDAGKNLIGFSYLKEGTRDDYGLDDLCYGVFSYDSKNGFKKDYEVGFDDQLNQASRSARGVYIGKVLYIISLGNKNNSVSIACYNLQTKERIASVNLVDE